MCTNSKNDRNLVVTAAMCDTAIPCLGWAERRKQKHNDYPIFVQVTVRYGDSFLSDKQILKQNQQIIKALAFNQKVECAHDLINTNILDCYHVQYTIDYAHGLHF